MNYATNFAVVENGIVTKVLWGMVYNMETDFPNAVQIDDRNVQVGDTYENGVFLHDGQEIKTIAEEMADMKAALELLGVQNG